MFLFLSTNNCRDKVMKNSAAAPVDLSQFNDDPVALKTQWVPLKGGGSSFKTHKLVNENPNRVSFKAGIGSIIFGMVFTLIGVAVPAVIIVTSLKAGKELMEFSNIIPLIIGLVFTTVGISIIYMFSKPVVFDKIAGYFWKGRKTPDRYSGQTPKSAVRLSDIHAFQLITEHVRGSERSFYSYELNLVLKDGSRHNVMDHGNIDELRRDAETLSKFMNKPVWDLTV